MNEAMKLTEEPEPTAFLEKSRTMISKGMNLKIFIKKFSLKFCSGGQGHRVNDELISWTKAFWKCKIIKMSTCIMVCIRSRWVITKSSSDHVIRSCDEPDMNNPISKRVLSRPAKCNDLESKYYRIGNFLEFCKIYEDCKIFKINGTPVPVMIHNWGGRIHRLESVTIQKSLNPRKIVWSSKPFDRWRVTVRWPFRFLEWNSLSISYFWNFMKVQNWDRLLKFFLEHSSSVCSGIILRIIDHVSGNSRKFQKIPNSGYRFSMKFSKLIYANIASKSV